MKTIVIFLALLLSFTSFGQSDNKQEVVIQTSAECGQCKKRIEEKLNYTRGVVFAELDVPSKKLTVKFKADKITLDEIRTIITELGYDADDVKANPSAVKKLPKCCQPNGMK